MKKSICALLISSALFGCGSTVNMTTSDAVAAQPKLMLKTDGTFWGFGPEAVLILPDCIKVNTRAVLPLALGSIPLIPKEGEMVAEVTRKDNGKTWTLVCSGGGTSVDLGSFSFGGNGPYVCEISENGKSVGEYQMARKSEAISLSTAKKRNWLHSLRQYPF